MKISHHLYSTSTHCMHAYPETKLPVLLPHFRAGRINRFLIRVLVLESFYNIVSQTCAYIELEALFCRLYNDHSFVATLHTFYVRMHILAELSSGLTAVCLRYGQRRSCYCRMSIRVRLLWLHKIRTMQKRGSDINLEKKISDNNNLLLMHGLANFQLRMRQCRRSQSQPMSADCVWGFSFVIGLKSLHALAADI